MLRSKIATLTAAAAKRHYASLPKLNGTITAAVRLRMARQANLPLPPAVSGKFSTLHAENVCRLSNPSIVPLGSAADTILADIKAANPRLREWTLGATAAKCDSLHAVYTTGDNSNWKKRSTFRRGVKVRSFATATRKTAVLTLMDQQFTIDAPRGYRWDVDTNGLFLRGCAGDYHPTADELIGATHDKCHKIVSSLKDAAAVRRKASRKVKQQLRMLKLAEQEGATVCIFDSVRAGNCPAGSQSWARSHGLNPSGHYTPTEVLQLANGDASRIAIVVAAAMRRHRVEMDRGYAVLADHR